MHMHLSLATALVGASAVLAGPVHPLRTLGPGPDEVERAIEERAGSCTFSGTSGYASAMKSKASCSTITLNGLSVPAGVTLDMTGLKDGTTVIFEGKTTWGYKEWAGPLFSVSGTNIKVTGAANAVLDGQGAKWWDGKGDSGKAKPKFFAAHKLTTSTIENIYVLNPPHQVFSINGVSTLTLSGITIDASAGDTAGGKNTDCFDIGDSDGVTIKNAVCKNQDDCVAVNSGTNINFSGGTCSGGHGLSIGSVGGRDNNVVSNVHFSDSKISNSENGVRIKTKAGTTGSVKGITYSGITLDNITKYGIYVTQAYDGDKATTGVPISNFNLDGVKGTVGSKAWSTYVDCGSTSSCSSWTWTNVAVTGGKGKSCSNEPSAAKSYC